MFLLLSEMDALDVFKRVTTQTACRTDHQLRGLSTENVEYTLKCFGVTKQLAECLSRKDNLALIHELQRPEKTMASMVPLGSDSMAVKIGPDPVTVDLLLAYNITDVSCGDLQRMHRVQRLGLLHELNRAAQASRNGFYDDHDSDANATANDNAKKFMNVGKELAELSPDAASKEVSTLTMPQMCRLLRVLGVEKDAREGMSREDRTSTIRELMTVTRPSIEVASVLLCQQYQDCMKFFGESDDEHKHRKMRKAHYMNTYISGLYLES
jgi:hypothetical protein